MAGYASYKYGIDPEDDSYLYGQSGDPYSSAQYDGSLGATAPSSGPSAAGLGTAAAGGAAMGGPMGAGIAVGGQFLTQYLAQKAANERAKRDRAVQIEQDYTKNQTGNLSNLLAAYRGALR